MDDTSNFEKRMQERLTQFDEIEREKADATKIANYQVEAYDRQIRAELSHTVSLLQERNIVPDVHIYQTVDTGRTYTRGGEGRYKTTFALKEHRLAGQAWLLSRQDAGENSDGYTHCTILLLSKSGMLISLMCDKFENHFAKRLYKAPLAAETEGFWKSLLAPSVQREQEYIPAPHDKCLIDPREYIPNFGLENFYDSLANRLAGRPYIHEQT